MGGGKTSGSVSVKVLRCWRCKVIYMLHDFYYTALTLLCYATSLWVCTRVALEQTKPNQIE